MKVGDKVLIRGVAFYYVGRIESIEGGFVALSDASWVADTGRFNHALTTGELSEVEPYPAGVHVAVACILDVSPWNHALPSAVK